MPCPESMPRQRPGPAHRGRSGSLFFSFYLTVRGYPRRVTPVRRPRLRSSWTRTRYRVRHYAAADGGGGAAPSATRSRCFPPAASATCRPGGGPDSEHVAEWPGAAAPVVLTWTGDRSPIRGCTTTAGDQIPPRTRFRIYVAKPFAAECTLHSLALSLRDIHIVTPRTLQPPLTSAQ
jgi:hypothetical protein